ncbi:MAG: FkbM family methyltransferase [Pseudomonadota bacterium]
MTARTAHRWRFLMDAVAMEGLPSVVDVGANPLDDPPYKPLLEAGLCKVHGFEPQKEAFDNLVSQKGEMESYTNAALGDGDSHELNIYGGSGLTSFYEIDTQAMDFLGRAKRPARRVETVAVQTKRLDDVAEIEQIDLLKIDVQGAEDMIFKGGKSKLSQAVAVITELRLYPLYHQEPMLDIETATLANLGFAMHKFLFIKNQMVSNSQKDRLRTRRIGSQALDGDCVFVRDLRDPAAVSAHQLKALSLLSDAVFESYDLALHCLDMLVQRGLVAPGIPSAYVDLLPEELRKN